MNEVQVDLIGKDGGQGDIASTLQGSQLNIGAMRPFIGNDGKHYMTVYNGGNPKKPSSYNTIQVNDKGTLRRDEWRQLDDALVGVSDNRLSGFQYFVNKGLTYNLGNAMGTTVLEYHTVSDAMNAELSMDAVTRSQGDRPEFDSVFLPIPILHSDYEINQRVLENSRRLGNPLDTTSAERAARRIMEKREQMLYTDTDYKFGGGVIYSLVNYPDRVYPGHADAAKQIANLSDWADPAVTGSEIVQDVLAMKQASLDQQHYGPWVLQISSNFETKLDEDYSSSKGSNSIRERVLAIAGIQDIEVVDTLAADNVLLVQLTSDVIRIVQGMGMQNIQWQTEGGFVNKYKTIAIQVPQIRSDSEGKTGIVHNYPATT